MRNEHSFLSESLIPVSWLYGRAALWRRRWSTRRAVDLASPVISVGNITCGGTGKTPMVEKVARDLLHLGRKPVILSRGYARRGARSMMAKEGLLEGNDEFHVLRANIPEVPHLQGKDRCRSGLEALSRGADALILDDGFQYTRLRRDLDIVLIDAILPFGSGRVLPSGLLREPLEVLASAHLFGISRSDQIEPVDLSTLRAYLRSRFPGIRQILLETHPLAWIKISGGSDSPGALGGKRVLAFCGIGNPESFRRQLFPLGVMLQGMLCFRDHHRYTAGDLQAIGARAADLKAEEIVTTQKDAVKIPLSSETSHWRYLRVEQRIASGEDEYMEALSRVLKKR